MYLRLISAATVLASAALTVAQTLTINTPYVSVALTVLHFIHPTHLASALSSASPFSSHGPEELVRAKHSVFASTHKLFTLIAPYYLVCSPIRLNFPTS